MKRIKGELEMILGNRLVSAEEIAARFGVTIRTVRRDLNRLRTSFKIEWIPTGPTSGYWEVTTENGTLKMDENTIENVLENDENVRKDVRKELTERQIVIVDLIKKDVRIGIEEMSVKMSVNERTIRRDINVLKEMGILVRIGGRKNGHWEIVE